MKFSIKTLGCKINQFDAGQLSEALVAGGAVPAADGEASDVCIIQTCTVTKKSDYHCRQAIRKAVREKPGTGRVVVTGCYAQASPDEILGIPGVDMVVPNSEREGLPALLLGGTPICAAPLKAGTVCGRSRAFLKVQEGCGSSCSYCIVPRARGASRSAHIGDVLDKARGLMERGYHEIVLTGVHLGAYGRDLSAGYSLDTLVERLLELDGLGRLRLSSIEPMEFDGALMSLIGAHATEKGRLCRHFHVPLQSADDKVLESMGRGYRWEDYLSAVSSLAEKAPEACIGADVIVGYPLEDEASFETTFQRIEGSPINYLHVFSYSPRPGTAAFKMGDPVLGDVKRERSRRLRELAAGKNMELKKGLLGRSMQVIVEEKEGLMTGLTDNYVRVAFKGEGLLPGRAADVIIKSLGAGTCRGVVA